MCFCNTASSYRETKQFSDVSGESCNFISIPACIENALFSFVLLSGFENVESV